MAESRCVDYGRHESWCDHPRGPEDVHWETRDGCGGRLCLRCRTRVGFDAWDDVVATSIGREIGFAGALQGALEAITDSNVATERSACENGDCEAFLALKWLVREFVAGFVVSAVPHIEDEGETVAIPPLVWKVMKPMVEEYERLWWDPK